MTLAAAAFMVGISGESQAVQPPPASPALDKFVHELPNPLAPPFRLDTRESGRTVALDEVVGTHVFGTQAGVPFGPTPTFGYVPAGASGIPGWGAYLGPTIEAVKGVPITMTVTNKLAQPAPAGYTYPTPAPGSGSNAACQAAGLKITAPMANYFDSTVEGSKDIYRCAPPTAVHLHGGHTDVNSDGGVMDVFQSAGVNPVDFGEGTGSVTYSYGNDQEPAALWYHDHAMANTRFNPMTGLAGFYLIRDGNDTGYAGNPLGLPYTDATAAHEVPIVLQDRSFNANGTFAYPPGVTAYHPNWAPESFNDVSVVNGTAWPKWTVRQGLYRVRLLNGSNARFYQLQVQNTLGQPAPVPIYQIGAEGGLFNRPAPITTLPNGRLLIAPGERADLVFDFRNVPAGAYTWFNNASAPFPNGRNNLKQIMQFNVTAGNDQAVDPRWTPTAWGAAPAAQTITFRGGTGREPAMAATVPPASGTPATNSCWTATNTVRPCIRTVFLNEVWDPVTGAPVEVLLNNLNLAEPEDPTSPTGYRLRTGPGVATATINTAEEWDIVNVTVDAHPIHLHATQFQVVNRQNLDSVGYLAAVNPGLPFGSPFTKPAGPGGTGVQNSNGTLPPPDPTPFLKNNPQPPNADEHGWKDTVIAYPGQVTRLLVPFGGTADTTMTLPTGYTGPTSAFTGGPGAQFTGTFVWHCHILEHEENDMMQPLVIKP